MGYYLTFAFDKECKNSIILMEGTLEEIDKFTSQFKSSVDVRKKFKKEIDQFCTEKSEYIKKVEEKTNRKETGDIAIYSIVGKVHETAMNKRTKVLYKFYIDIFNELIKNKELMSMFSKKCYNEEHCDKYGQLHTIVSLTDSKIFRLTQSQMKILAFYKNYSENDYNYALRTWKKNMKLSDKYYSTIREIFILYQFLVQKQSNLPSFEQLINKYKPKKLEKINHKTTKVKFDIQTDEETINENDYYDDLKHCQDYYDTSMTNEEINEYFEEIVKRKTY